MNRYKTIGSIICDKHYRLLKREYEEFSCLPLASDICDFCNEKAAHWIPIELSQDDFNKTDAQLLLDANERTKNIKSGRF